MDAKYCTGINWGTLKEIPGISINRFGSIKGDHNNPVNWASSRAFFLTSHDPASVKDVLSLEFLTRLMRAKPAEMVLYMHPVSYKYLIDWISTSRDEDFLVAGSILKQFVSSRKIVFLTIEDPIVLTFVGAPTGMESVRILTLSAGHKPGSVMLLFETNIQRILFTGYCRVVLKDLKSCQHLYGEDGRLKPITSLYIDTTFCVDNVQELPSRRTVINETFQMIKAEIGSDPEACFEFWSPGPLAYQDNLHFIQAVYYSFIGKVQVEVVAEAENDLDEAECCVLRFYANFAEVSFAGGQALVVPDSEDEYQFQEPKEIRLACDMELDSGDDVQLNENGLSIYNELNNCWRGIYSNHLSRFELGRIVNFLNVSPENVHPLVLPKDASISEVKMVMESSCNAVFGQEPKDLLDEHPSHVYDFTGALEPKKSANWPTKMVQEQFLHMY